MNAQCSCANTTQGSAQTLCPSTHLQHTYKSSSSWRVLEVKASRPKLHLQVLPFRTCHWGQKHGGGRRPPLHACPGQLHPC